MWLDLSKIIEMPGGRKSFEVTLDPERLADPAILRFKYPPEVRGEVVNTAGLLNLRGKLKTEMTCVCDRCGTAFDRKKVLSLDVPLAADVADEDSEELSPEVFEIEGDGIDLDEVLETCFILDMETKCLCREDCLGLCPTCGKNLNEGPCSCTKSVDPRLAALAQLLDGDQSE